MFDVVGAWDVLQQVGATTGTYAFTNWAEFEAAASTLGYSAVVNDIGSVIGYTKLTTSTATASYLPQVVTSISGGTAGAAGSLTTAGTISSVAIPVAVAGVAAALGGAIGIELSEKYPDIYDEMYNVLYGNGDTVLAKLTDVVIDGVNYLSGDSINTIKDFLIEKNAFSATAVQDFDIKGTSKNVSVTSKAASLNDFMSFIHLAFSNYIGKKLVIPDSYLISFYDENISHIPTNTNFTTMSVDFASGESGTRILINSFNIKNNNVNLGLQKNTSTYFPNIIDKYPNWNSMVQNENYEEQNSSLVYTKQQVVNTSFGRVNTVITPVSYYNVVGVNMSYNLITMGLANNTTTYLNGLDDFNLQPDATYPTTDPIETTYPEWPFIELPSYDENGQPNGTKKYYPITLPDVDPVTGTPTADQTNGQTGNTDKEYPQDNILAGLQDMINQLLNGGVKVPVDPDTGNIGDSGVIPPTVSASASGLITVYNPTLAQINSFAGYLWSTNFIDQILKLFSDPMSAIIGLHILYANPQISGINNIKVGYLDSGVPANVVSNQYTSVSCGSVSLSEYFGDATDYSPYTKVHIYLPFIGIVELNTDDVIKSTLSLEYKVDVLTGTCLANITVTKDESSAVLYTYNGNCAVQLPLSGGNYGSILASLIGAGVGIVGAVASGGAIAPVAIGGAMAIGHSKAQVSMSGSLGANAGAMGIRTPYVIINRPVPLSAETYNQFYGYPSNKTVQLGNLNGFTKVKDVHVNGINATETELNQIETLLKEGVII